MTVQKVSAGLVEDLRAAGRLTTKLGSLPVLVVADGDEVHAIEDRCPHLGFPLARGAVGDGIITCHWHHARFDLASGCTFDPWADDARAFDVEVADGQVWVCERADVAGVEHHERRLREGLEGDISLVTAKAVLALLDESDGVERVLRTTLDFGLSHRGPGWGSGMTILVAMANVVPHLRPGDRALALVHAAAHVADDTAGHVRAFVEPPMTGGGVDPDRLTAWYRRFVDTRSADAAQRVLVTAVERSDADVVPMLVAAATDHVWLDGGHTLDFTNKAVELVELSGDGVAAAAYASLTDLTCAASRAEESAAWRHPVDLAGLSERTEAELVAALAGSRAAGSADVAALAWELLDDDAEVAVAALVRAARDGATAEELARAVTHAAALRIARFHTRNDHGDWDTVHHAFTTANAVHRLIERHPTDEAVRAIVHGALKVHLDRFLNIPAARLPTTTEGSLADLTACWDEQGRINEAGGIAHGFLAGGGDRAELIASLGAALLAEDAGFHWFQLYEAAVRQSLRWPEESEESALPLVAFARFLAAHTPTRRELPRVVDIARRLRRGEALFAED
ncbi:MAG: Rieske 2Fe-2S domain-containing protein [Actinomycetota bacterium]